MPENYILVVNGKPAGPFNLEQLRDCEIKPGDFVKSPGMDDYKEAHEIAELRAFFGFNKQPLVPQYFAGFDQRLLASALDWFFVSGACIITVFVISLMLNDKAALLAAAFSLFIIIPVINLVFHIVMEGSEKQATFGKQILRIQVCDLEGNPISFLHAAGRNLAKLASVLTLFTGYLYSFFNKKQQCLHDRIAGTLVMKDRLL